MILLNIVSILFVTFLGFPDNHTKLYRVDGLDINVNKSSTDCLSGYRYKYFINGEINNDLLFVLTKLFEQEDKCIDITSYENVESKVFLDSTGGYTEPAYDLGRLFRKYKINTIIENDVSCSSACAITFLGGSVRYISERAMINFHQPYTIDKYVDEKPIIKCGEDTTILMQYFVEMTNDEVGNTLHDRSLLYCGTDAYWQIYGSNSALLYGIATTNIK